MWSHTKIFCELCINVKIDWNLITKQCTINFQCIGINVDKNNMYDFIFFYIVWWSQEVESKCGGPYKWRNGAKAIILIAGWAQCEKT